MSLTTSFKHSSKRKGSDKTTFNSWEEQLSNRLPLDESLSTLNEDGGTNPALKTPYVENTEDKQSVDYGNTLASNVNIEDYQDYMSYNKEVPVGLGEERLNNIRADNQSGLAQLGKGLVKIIPSAAAKLGASIGYLGGSIEALALQDKTKIFDNAVADWFEKLDENVKNDFLPIYTSKKYNEGNILQKMGTTSFWATDIFDGIAYLASAVIGSKGLGALGAAAGIGGKALTGAEIVSQSIMEAGAEADGVAKDVEKRLRASGVTDEDYIKQAKGNAGLNTFLVNAAILMPSSFKEQQWFKAVPIDNMKELSKKVLQGTISKEEIASLTSLTKSALKGMGEGIVAEGLWEEGIQTATSNYFADAATGKTNKNFLEGITDEYFRGYTTQEGLQSMVTGAIIGGVAGGVHGFSEGKEAKKAVDEGLEQRGIEEGKLKESDKKLIDDLNIVRTADALFPDHVSANNDEGKLDQKGILDLTQRVSNEEYNTTQATLAATTGDLTKATFINNIALGQHLWNHLTNEIYPNANSAIEGAKQGILNLAAAPTEGANAEDVEKYKKTKENLEAYAASIEELGSKYMEYADKSFTPTNLVITSKEKLDNDLVKDTIARKLYFMEAVKQQAYNKMLAENPKDEAKVELKNLIEDSKKFQEKLTDKTERNIFLNKYALTSENKYTTNHIVELENKLSKATDEKEKNRLNFELEEAKAIEGELLPLNKVKSLQEVKKLKKGLRQGEHFNLGEDYLKSREFNSKLDSGATTSDLTQTLLSKNTITEEESNNLWTKAIHPKRVRLAQLNSSIKEVENRIEEFENPIIKVGEYGTDEYGRNDYNEYVANQQQEDLTDNTKVAQERLANAAKFKQLLNSLDREQYNKDKTIKTEYDNSIKEVEVDDKLLQTIHERQLADEERDSSNKGLDIDDKLRKKYVSNLVATDIDGVLSRGESDNYNNVTDVDKAIRTLEGIKEVYTERGTIEKFRGSKDLLTDLREALPKLLAIQDKANKNKNAKDKLDAIAQEQYEKLNLLKLGLATDSSVVNTELNKKISEVLDDEYKLSSPVTKEEVELIIEKLRGNIEFKKFLKTLLPERNNLILKEEDLSDFEKELFKTLNVKDIPQQFIYWLANPNRGIFNIIEFLGVKKELARKYFLSKNLNSLIELLKGDTKLSDKYSNVEILAILKEHEQLVALDDFKKDLSSTYTLKEQLGEELRYNVGRELAPTNQQLNTGRQIVRWLKTNLKSTSSLSTYGYLRGIAGTGKTWLMKFIIGTSGLKTNEVFITANNKSATENIGSSITNVNTANEPIQKDGKLNFPTDLKGIKLLIVDEIGALTTTIFDELSLAVTKENNRRVVAKEDLLHVLVLGDPSQINNIEVGKLEQPPIENFYTNRLNITDFNQLTITYRSNVGAITDLIDSYLDETKEVKSLVVKSNTEKQAMGVKIGSTQTDLLNELNNNKGRVTITNTGNNTQSNTSTKVIIVDSELEVNKYKASDIEASTEVLTYKDAQGRTFDEVYIDINKNKFNLTTPQGILDYNRVMYTAISRARNFVYLTDYTNTFKQEYNDKINIYKEESDKKLTENKDRYTKRLETELAAFKAEGKTITPTQPVTTTTKTVSAPITTNTVEEEDDDDLTVLDGNDEEIDEVDETYETTETVTDENSDLVEDDKYEPNKSEFIITGDIEVSKGIVKVHAATHSLAFPTKRQIDTDNDLNTSLVKVGDPVYYVNLKDHVGVFAPTNNPVPESYQVNDKGVNVPTQFTRGSGLVKIGIIYKDSTEYKNLINAGVITVNPKTGSILGNSLKGYSEDNIIGLMGIGELVTAQPLKYVYDRSTVTNSIVGLWNKFINKFIKNEPNMKDTDPSLDVVIFSNTDEKGKGGNSTLYTALNKKTNINTKKGIPYAIFTVKVGKNTIRQWVRQNPRKINKSDVESGFLKPLKEFTDSLKRIDSIVSYESYKLHDILPLFKKNFSIDEWNVVFNSETVEKAEVEKILEKTITDLEFETLKKEINTYIVKGYYGVKSRPINYTPDSFDEFYSQDKSYEKTTVAIDGKMGYLDANSKELIVLEGKNAFKYTLQSGKYKKEGGALRAKVIQGLQGDAVHAGNLLARANKYVASVKIRLERKQNGTTVTLMKSIINVKPKEGTYVKGLQKIIKKFGKIDEYNNLKITSLEETANFMEANNICTKDSVIAQFNDRYKKVLTLQDLSNIVDNFDADGNNLSLPDENGNSYYLRLPLDMNKVNEYGKDVTNNSHGKTSEEKAKWLNENIETNLKDIIPTTIRVQFGKAVSEESVTSKVEPVNKVEEVKEETTPVDTSKELSIDNYINDIVIDDNEVPLMKEKGTKQDLGKDLTLKEVLELFKKFLPNATPSQLSIVADLVKAGITSKAAWGAYLKGVVYLEGTKEGTFKSGVVRHEVFHLIFNDFLTEKERDLIIKDVIKLYPELSNVSNLNDIEEFLADKFMDYDQKDIRPKSNRLTRFFNYVKKLLGFTKDNRSELDKLFDKIESGYFTKKISDVKPLFTGVKELVNINSFFNNVFTYRVAKNLIQTRINKFREKGITIPFKSKDNDGKDVITYKIYSVGDSRELVEFVKVDIQNLLNTLLKNRQDIEDKLLNPEGKFSDEDLHKLEDKQFKNHVSIETVKKTLEHWNMLLKVIYPNLKRKSFEQFKLEAEDLVFENNVIAEYALEDKGVSIKEHIQASDEQNHEAKTTDRVKDYLANIPIKDSKGNILEYVNPRIAFIRTLQMLHPLQTWAGKFIQGLEFIMGEKKDKYTKAIVEAIKDLYTKATDTLYNDEVYTKSKFLDENTFIIAPEGNVLKLRGLNEVEQYNLKNPTNEIKVYKREKLNGKEVNTPTFQEALVKATKEELPNIRRMFDAYTANTIYNEVMTHFKSQGEKIFKYMEIKNEFGVISTSYKTSQELGAISSTKNNLLNDIVATFKDKGDGNTMQDNIKAYWAKNEAIYNGFATKSDVHGYIKKFLKDIGFFGADSVTLPNENLGGMVTDIKYFLSNDTRVAGADEIVKELTTKDKNDDDDQADSVREDSITSAEEIIEREAASLLKNLTEKLVLNNKAVRATSVISADNIRKYIWSTFSQALDTLYLIAGRNGTATIFDKFTELPEYLETTFYKLNPFNPLGKSSNQKIYDTIQHDGNKNLDVNGEFVDATMYSKEKFNDTVTRTFIGGFMNAIGFSNKNNVTYNQFFMTPSDKPFVNASKVNVLTSSQIKNNIKIVLDQLEHKTTEEWKEGTKLLNSNAANPSRVINFDPLYYAIEAVYTGKNTVIAEELKDNIKTGVKLIYIDKLYEGLDVKGKEELKDKIATNMYEVQYMKEAERYFDKLVESDVLIPKEINNVKLDSIIDRELFPQYKDKHISDTKTLGGEFRTLETWSDVAFRVFGIANRTLTDDEKSLYPRDYKISKEDLLPIIHAYVSNYAVNSYFLNQLVTGDMSNFKTAKDLIKRMSIVFSTGIRPLVDEELGMKKKYTNLVVKDVKEVFNAESLMEIFLSAKGMTTEEARDLSTKMAKSYSEKGVDIFDGFSLILPERFEQLNFALGKGYNLGSILKPVYYGMTNLVSRKNDKGELVPGSSKFQFAEKCSKIVLTDELIYGRNSDGVMNVIPRFPELKHIRDNMRKLNAEELVFESAVKIGSPAKLANLESLSRERLDTDKLIEENINSIVELDNTNYRLQLNPIHDLDSLVSNPTQITYHVNPIAPEIAMSNFEAFTRLVEMGLSEFKSSITKNGVVSEEKVKKLMLDKLQGDGNERTYELVNKLGINFPAVVDKCLIQLSTELSKLTTLVKFPGSKLVLAANVGIKIVDSKGVLRPLKYTQSKVNGKVVSQVESIIGRGMLSKAEEKQIDEINDHNKRLFEAGEKTGYKDYPVIYLHNPLLGFRIPSSGLNDIVCIKPVGFHGEGLNQITVPSMVVLIEGSDYDVDSLFVIRMSGIQDEKGNTIKPIGFKEANDIYYMETKIPNEKDVKEEYDRLVNDKEYYIKSNGKLINLQGLSELEAHKLIAKEWLKNSITQSFLEVGTNPDNNQYMYSNTDVSEIRNDLKELAREKGLDDESQLLINPNLTSPVDAQIMQEISLGSKSGVGIFAQLQKMVNYCIYAGDNGKAPLLKMYDNTKEKNELPPLVIDEVIFDRIVNDRSVFKILGSFLNAAVDGVKEQILPVLNLTDNSIKTFGAMIATGVSMRTANRIMTQPVIYKVVAFKRGGITTMDNRLKALHNDVDYTKIELTTDGLISYLQYNLDEVLNKKNENLTEEDKAFISYQRKVLDYYGRFTEIGSSLTDLSTYLGILKSLPVLKEDIDRIIDTRAKIFETKDDKLVLDAKGKLVMVEGFPFNLENFFEANPHIEAANKCLDNLNKFAGDLFYKHKPEVYDFIKETFSGLDVSLDFVKGKSDLMKRNELIKYIISGLKWGKVNYDEIPPYINYKTNAKKSKKNKDKVFVQKALTGKKAFTQHFITKMELLKKDSRFKENMFVNGMVIKTSWNGFKRLRFDLGTNLAIDDIQELQDDFNALKDIKFTYNNDTWEIGTEAFNTETVTNFNDFQYEFVNYAILTSGLSFGATNYTSILPPEIYESFQEAYTKEMDKLLEDKGKRLERLKEHFGIEVAVNYTDKLARVTGKAESTGKHDVYDPILERDKEVKEYDGVENGVYFDIKFPNEGKNLPKLMRREYKGKYTAFTKVGKSETHSYYQRIGFKNFTNTYDLNSKVLANGYSTLEAFRPDIYNKQVSMFGEEFETPSYVKEEDIISVTEYSDYARTNKKFFTVTKEGLVKTEAPSKYIVPEKVKEVAPIIETTPTTGDKTPSDARNNVDEVEEGNVIEDSEFCKKK